jgi:hypothetical protein
MDAPGRICVGHALITRSIVGARRTAWGKAQCRIVAGLPPHNPPQRASILAGSSRKWQARGRRDGYRRIDRRRSRSHGRHLHGSGHRIGSRLACGRGLLVGARRVKRGLPSKRQADGGSTDDSGSGTELYHRDASVMGAEYHLNVKSIEVRQAMGRRSQKQERQRRRDISKQNKGPIQYT